MGLWWDPFIQSRKCMSLKFTGEFCVMTMKNDAKFEKELTCQFKSDMRNLTILTTALKNLKNWHFNGLLLNKIYNVWTKKGIGQFCLMALNIDATFDGRLTCAFENYVRNLANFHQNTWKCQNKYFNGILLFKVENIWV